MHVSLYYNRITKYLSIYNNWKKNATCFLAKINIYKYKKTRYRV